MRRSQVSFPVPLHRHLAHDIQTRLIMFELCCRGACANRLAIPSAFGTNATTLLIQLMNGGRVDVGGRGNRAHTAVAHIGEQERLAPDENIESASRTGS